MFRGLSSIIYKEFFHAMRDPRTLLLLLMLPAIELTIFGYAIDLDVKHIPTAVYNLDGRRESRELIDRFSSSGNFDIVKRAVSDEDLQQSIVRGEAQVGIKIGPDFTDQLVKGGKTQVQILIDGSDSTVAMQAMNVGNAIALNSSLDILARELDVSGGAPIEARPRVLFNPDLRTANFMVPGLVGMIMQVVTMLLTSFAIVKEKETGTLEQLMVTPVSRLGLMLGKLIPYAVTGIVQTTFVVSLMRFLFGVPINGSILLLACFSLCFLVTVLGMGLLVSTVAENQMQAVQISLLFILPAILLSGLLFPQDNMPPVIWAIGQVIPATYFIRILRGIILRGAGLSDLWQEGVCLLAMSVLSLGVAAARFQKKLG